MAEKSVRFGGVTAPASPVARDVLQDSVLGPLLFILYASDISVFLTNAALCQCYTNDMQLYFHIKPSETTVE